MSPSDIWIGTSQSMRMPSRVSLASGSISVNSVVNRLTVSRSWARRQSTPKL